MSSSGKTMTGNNYQLHLGYIICFEISASKFKRYTMLEIMLWNESEFCF